MTKTLIPSPPTELRRSDFEFELPAERIAQTPMSPRDHSHLMVVQSETGSIQHQRFHEIERFLRAGDVLVLNATRVFPARLRGTKPTGGKVEILLLRPETSDQWQALVHGKFSVGSELHFPEGLTARFEERLENGEWRLRFKSPHTPLCKRGDGGDFLRAYLDRHGEMPLPPYIKRKEKNAADR